MATKPLELAGLKQGKLLAIRRKHKDKSGNYFWECLCDCGKKVFVRGSFFRRGFHKSCGCGRTGGYNRTHGMSAKVNKSEYKGFYRTYDNIKQRCTNPKDKSFKYYGGRGIKMCSEWFNSFLKFKEDMFESWFLGATIDRIDNDGDYCKENCQWLTREDNVRKEMELRKKQKASTMPFVES